MKMITLAAALDVFSNATCADGKKPGTHLSANRDPDGVVSLKGITARRRDVVPSFDEARANTMENNGGHGQDTGMRRASQGMTIAFNHIDGNGEVAREVFLAHATEWLAIFDRNDDSGVTPADFGRQ